MEGAVKNATKQVDTASTLSAGLALMGREERERYDKQVKSVPDTDANNNKNLFVSRYCSN